MNDITCLFTSHYSLDSGSLLTLEEPGKAKLGAPQSVFDLATQVGLKEVVLVESKIDGFIEGYKTSTKLGIKMCFGYKVTIVNDHRDKDERSRATESKVILFIRDEQGYHDLIRIHNRANTDGHFTTRDGSYGRADWTMLKEFWTSHLMLGLPFFSSFLARNTLTMNRVVPDLPKLETPLWVFREVDSQLPFASLIDEAIDRYVEGARAEEYGLNGGVEVVPCKTIYYRDRKDLKPYIVRRAIHNRSSWDAPDVDHLSSAEFSFESWKEWAVRRGVVA